MSTETGARNGPRVALFVTCLVNVFRPQIAEAGVNLLRAAGCSVAVPLAQTCCGQPGYNAGALASAQPMARRVIELFEAFDYVVAPSGSCAGMIREHYPRLFENDTAWQQRARKVAMKTHEICAFLVDVLQFSPVQGKQDDGADIVYHDSCAGLRELGIRTQPRALLAGAGVKIREMAATEVCCGFGGTFCARMPEISVAMADEKISHAVASGASTLVGGDLGCLLHLAARLKERGIPLQCRHTVEYLDDRLDAPAIGAETRR